LRDATEDIFPPVRGPWGRYALMGALMVAHDAANAETERLAEPSPRSAEATA
jgi:hypothetical protein